MTKALASAMDHGALDARSGRGPAGEAASALLLTLAGMRLRAWFVRLREVPTRR
ncbi:hypothetical protein [Streptomyces sp. NPDC048650]|uniref:hypothetical protein n=1 Tax=Streptomyces sp. NPDC048650 TaxID=3365583 RepID=UPI003717D58C